MDPTLPRLVRGQHTFGYSYTAFAFAAAEARAQDFAFSLDGLESVIDVGLDLITEKTKGWADSAWAFMSEIGEWIESKFVPESPMSKLPID